ncbi:MAG: hypothetical protein FJX77_16565, partial [Armatimonadetes bacterium]|nr:hypothetical protein [Armatimonadota bacterium]
AQPARYSPTAAEREQLAARRQALEERVRRLTAAAPEALRPRVADAAVFLHIAEMAEKLSLYTNAAQVGAVLRGLETGLERCRLLEQGEAPWTTQPGRTLRGFVSRIDGSIQPYGLVLPAGYRPQSGGIREGTAPRLDVVLHGRGPTEVSFLQQNLPATNTPPNQEFLELHPFGRGNNGWRWAGETDVFEALAQVEQEHHLDPDRILLRGFSMGGHGAWHIGVHHPTRWAGVSPGAGFSETRRYARITQPVPPYEEAAWHIYDAVDYALNLFNTPFITYGGDRDPQLQASLNMKAAAAREGLPLNLIIGPDTEHRYHPESLRRIMEQLATYRRPSARPEIRFTTWTLKYNQCDYVRVDALRRHYERAVVNAKVEGDTLRVGTLNVAALTLSPLPSGVRAVELDGERLPVERGSLRALREADGWRPAGAGASGGRRKQHGLQGPIDDAFTSRFVVVEGSGEAWSPTVQAHGRRELERFQEEWRLAFRGTVPRISDVQFREADWKDANLVLLGDPGSNRVLRRVLRGLPLQWSQERVVVNGKEYGP